MSETPARDLNAVPETYLAPLYWKAMESLRPDAMIKDEKAVALVTQNSIDFSRAKQVKMNELLQTMRIIFTREMDRYARDFLVRHPQSVVVHIGCGLDSRFERVDNGIIEWYDLDLPEVIVLRRKFIGDEGERHHLLACSVLEDAWLEAVEVHLPLPFRFLAETVFLYFTEAQVKSLVLTLREHFPGAELVNSLPVLGKDELVRWSNEVYHPYATHCSWWVAGSAFIQANFIGDLRRDLLYIVSPDDIIALLSNVSTGDEFLSSLGIVVGLDRLRRGKISRDEYVRKHGHRGPHEAEMSIPRPAEHPNWINEQLEGLERASMDVETLLQEQRARYEIALINLQKAAPQKFDSFLQRVKEAARLTRLREAARSEYIRVFGVMRAFVLRAGALCGLGEETFFLEHDEIIRLLSGQDEVTSQIPARKNAYRKFSALPEYPTIIVGCFDPFTWAADPHRRTDIYDTNHRIGRRFTDQIKGSPGAAGQAEGRVRIVNSPEEGCQLQPDEILVAITTNVGWTPLFPRAAAVVTDVGAPLSHAAIVARELGIPAVVGCGNATTLLKTGDRVRVDGGRDVVEILSRQIRSE